MEKLAKIRELKLDFSVDPFELLVLPTGSSRMILEKKLKDRLIEFHEELKTMLFEHVSSVGDNPVIEHIMDTRFPNICQILLDGKPVGYLEQYPTTSILEIKMTFHPYIEFPKQNNS